MSFAFRASLLLLALSLNLVNSAPAQSQSSSSGSKSPPLIPGSPQSSDEATIRAAAEKYGSAIAAGDLETMRQLWNLQSPNLSSRLRLYQGLFSKWLSWRSRRRFRSLQAGAGVGRKDRRRSGRGQSAAIPWADKSDRERFRPSIRPRLHEILFR